MKIAIWTVIYQWEGQQVPSVRSFKTKDDAVAEVKRHWDHYARESDLDGEDAEMPKLLFVDMTLCCTFDSQEWCWIVESELVENAKAICGEGAQA